MHRQNRRGSIRQGPFHTRGIDVEALWVTVNQNGFKPVPEKAVGRGKERKARHDDLAFEVQTACNQHESGSATRNSHAVRDIERHRRALFQLSHPTPVRELRTFEHSPEFFEQSFRSGERRGRNRNLPVEKWFSCSERSGHPCTVRLPNLCGCQLFHLPKLRIRRLN